MRGVVVLAAVAGCYAPTPPTGVPCTPGPAACPHDQECTMVAGGGFACVDPDTGVTADAPIAPPDAPDPDADDDGDTIRNLDDNCPTIANTDQANEDGDVFGDVCDPCPAFTDSLPLVDPDGDGVSGACDPAPDAPGDRVVAFEGFARTTPPIGWNTAGANGGWMFDGDDAVIVASNGAINTLTTPVPGASTRLAVTAAFAITGITGAGTRSIGPVQMFQPSPERAISCELLRNGNGPKLAIVDVGGTGALAQSNAKFDGGQQAILTSHRDGTTYACDDGTVAVGAASAFTMPSPAAGVRTRSVSAHVQWVMIVGSP